MTPVLVHHGAHRLTGFTETGEGWAAAAERIAMRPVFPIDLSGEVKQFAADPWPVVAVRPMVPGDLPDLVRWLGQAHVRTWYAVDGEPTPQRVEEHYGPDLAGRTPTSLWVAEVNGRSIGMIQDYRIRDYPEYALLTPDPDAVGLDYLIGEPAWVGRGLGTRMLWSVLVGLPGRYAGLASAFAAPDHRNTRSLRVLAKLGFERGTWFDEPQRDGSTATVVGCTLDLARVLGAPSPAA